MKKIYDLLIIGAGPAGITASIYAARKRLDFVTISKDIGGQAVWSGEVENYTGYQLISGAELMLKFEEHMKSFGLSVNTPEQVEDLRRNEELFEVQTDKTKYPSRTVLIATGKRSRRLEVPGETEFCNRGISYCATCDAPLFKGKNVAVIGGGNAALDAVLQLMKFCPKVYLVDFTERLAADPIMVEKVSAASNVEIMFSAQVKKIHGNRFVQGMDIAVGGQEVSLDVNGVFVEIGLMPNSDFAYIIEKNAIGEIEVDCFNRSKTEGIYAAGDVTSVPEKQIIVACGEGAKACLSAFRYLSTHRY